MALQNALKALADESRRTILQWLKEGALPSGEIARRLNLSAPATSKHLAVLLKADLVRPPRKKNFIFYELNASVLEEVLLWIFTLKGESGQ